MKIFVLIFIAPLVIAQSWFTTNQDAELMISGVDFNNSGGSLLFNHPSGLATDGSNLIMCDRFNNRVLIWNTAPVDWNIPPDIVLGQNNFITNNPGTSKSNLNWPGNASVGQNGKLAVADTYNHRILLWNSFPTVNGQTADISINLPAITPQGTPQRWEWPWGVWTDGNKLAATATQGSTILFWNSFPTQDNQSPDFTITNPHFGTPRNISTDGATYFMVGDHNAKVVGDQAGTFFWNSYPSLNNQNYDFYKNEWIKGTKLPDGKFIAGGQMNIYTWDAVPTSSNSNPSLIASPSFYSNGDGVDVVYANSKIYVNNYNGNNVLVYNSPPSISSQFPLFALGVSHYNFNTLDTIGYIQNPCMATDGIRLIVSSDFDRKIYIYNNLPTVSGVLPNQIISTRSYDLAPWDIALYAEKFVAVGKQKVCIWNNNSDLSVNPSITYNNNIGNASFMDLRGAALDEHFFYLGDYFGKVYIWNGIPSNNNINPLITLNYNNNKLGRLSSDGTYFIVVQQDPAAVYIYKISDLLNGNTNPFKEIHPGQLQINLPNEAITFNGSFALANTNYSNILLWQDINDVPNPDKMIILGQNENSNNNIPQIGKNRLFLPATLLYINGGLWVGEVKFSSRIVKFKNPFTTSLNDNIFINNSFSLNQNYPNPFNPSTVIRFSTPGYKPVSLKLFDILGNEISTLIDWDSNNEPGIYDVTFSIKDYTTFELSSGLYFYQLKVGNQVQTKKMMLIR